MEHIDAEICMDGLELGVKEFIPDMQHLLLLKPRSNLELYVTLVVMWEP